MKIKLWGTRGSIPRPATTEDVTNLLTNLVSKAKSIGISDLDSFLEHANTGKLLDPISFGGNTPCVEVNHGNKKFFVDMGSGLRDAGTFNLSKTSEFTFFMTHLHLDHLLGLPFFIPMFMRGSKIIVYHVHKTAPHIIKGMFDGVTFPLKWDDLDADVEFRRLEPYQVVDFGEIKVTPFCLDHPGGSFGYRFDAAGKSAVIGFDGEYKRRTKEELGKDLPFYQNLDLLTFDAQYEMDELVTRFDWGHSSAPIGIDISIRENIRNMIMFHHDPWATDEKLRKYFESTLVYRDEKIVGSKEWTQTDMKKGPNIILGYDGLEIDLDKL